MSFMPGMFPGGAAAARASSFPQFVASNGSGNGTTGAGTHACALPTGIAAGQLLLLFVLTANTVTHTTPSGWTLLFTSSTGAFRLSTFCKAASGSEGATETVTFSGSAAASALSMSFSSYQGNPENGAAVIGTTGTTPNAPSLTPSWGSAKTLWLTVLTEDAAGSSGDVRTPPTNYGNAVERAELVFTLRTRTITVARRELVASSEDPGTWTIPSAPTFSIVNTIAIRPA